MLGDIIRSVRKQKRTTLKEISEKSGLSIGYISQIERNQTEPSLSTLRKISQALDVPTYYFMKQVELDGEYSEEDDYDESAIQTAPVASEKETPSTENDDSNVSYVKITSDQIVSLSLPNSHVKYHLLSPMPSPKYVPQSLVIRFELDPKSADGDFPVKHPSEEIIIVESGELVIEIPGEKIRLRNGESMLLKSNIPHTIYNELDTTVTGLSLFTPAIWFPIARTSN
ncbi:MAG: XRE family transcriptional regulator [Eubacteriales bacterium]|nr:XRE family transcriptional regulator [Eubacteriales bacterium]